MQVHLVAAGKFHDIDFARLELLKLLAEIPEIRTTVAIDYGDLDRIADCSLLITYTCDVIPTDEQIAGLASFLDRGGRWLALHGTNSVIQFAEGGAITPDIAPNFMALLGTRFVGHPPIEPFKVRISGDHPLTEGMRDFSTLDELYLSECTASIEVLMQSRFEGGACPDFADADQSAQDVPILYLRQVGEGAILYCTLGHCRGHYDLRPLSNFWPHPQRCSWDYPEFMEILRRGIRWGIAGQD